MVEKQESKHDFMLEGQETKKREKCVSEFTNSSLPGQKITEGFIA